MHIQSKTFKNSSLFTGDSSIPSFLFIYSFNNLRKFGKVNYYQRRSGEEIDFVLNERIGVEVKMRGLESNLRKLNNICKEIGLNESYLISNEYIEKENFIPATNI